MDRMEIEVKAKELMSLGKIEEAKELLIQEGFEKRCSKELQELFYLLIPESSELKHEKENSLLNLLDSDEKKRIESSRYIFKQARNEYMNRTKWWMGDPRTVDILFVALNDVNLKVRINIVGALWMISNRYLKDIRIFDQLILLLGDKSSDIRFYAAAGLSNYSFDSKWDHLISQLEKEKSKKVVDSITKNFYIKSLMGVWAEMSNERVADSLKKLKKYTVQNQKQKKRLK